MQPMAACATDEWRNSSTGWPLSHTREGACVPRAEQCSALRFSHCPMPFERHGPEPLDAVVNVRLTTAEKACVLEDAAIAGLTISAISRRRMLGRRVVANVDAAMIRELRRLGGLLKHLHVESAG